MTHDLSTAVEMLKRGRELVEKQQARVNAQADPGPVSVRLLKEMLRALSNQETHVSILERERVDQAYNDAKRHQGKSKSAHEA